MKLKPFIMLFLVATAQIFQCSAVPESVKDYQRRLVIFRAYMRQLWSNMKLFAADQREEWRLHFNENNLHGKGKKGKGTVAMNHMQEAINHEQEAMNHVDIAMNHVEEAMHREQEAMDKERANTNNRYRPRKPNQTKQNQSLEQEAMKLAEEAMLREQEAMMNAEEAMRQVHPNTTNRYRPRKPNQTKQNQSYEQEAMRLAEEAMLREQEAMRQELANPNNRYKNRKARNPNLDVPTKPTSYNNQIGQETSQPNRSPDRSEIPPFKPSPPRNLRQTPSNGQIPSPGRGHTPSPTRKPPSPPRNQQQREEEKDPDAITGNKKPSLKPSASHDPSRISSHSQIPSPSRGQTPSPSRIPPSPPRNQQHQEEEKVSNGKKGSKNPYFKPTPSNNLSQSPSRNQPPSQSLRPPSLSKNQQQQDKEKAPDGTGHEESKESVLGTQVVENVKHEEEHHQVNETPQKPIPKWKLWLCCGKPATGPRKSRKSQAPSSEGEEKKGWFGSRKSQPKKSAGQT